MEEQTVLRYARLLSLPDYDDTFSWLPVNGETNSKLPTSSSDTAILSELKNLQANGIKDDLFVDPHVQNMRSEYIFNEDFSPPIPDLSTLPTLEEVAFPVVDTAESNKAQIQNFRPLFTRSNSIPPSISLSNISPTNSDDIDAPEKPSTLPSSSRLRRSCSFNRRFPSKIATADPERRPSERHFISTGDIIPLPLCHPIKVENFLDSLTEKSVCGSFPTFPEFPITNGKLMQKSSSVSDGRETRCSSVMSGLSSVDENVDVKKVVYVSRSQSDLKYATPITRPRSLTFLPRSGDIIGSGKTSPDRTSEISPYNHPQYSPLMIDATALEADLRVLMTDDDGWMNSSTLSLSTN
ncbi:unnamed protein product [Hymenolepis diminuta]|uniref:Flocculation protein FLO11-like n=1 Tax=Hymenolepis diminuta TaxID=6216 RepID=A0A0R3STY1_HYMDI|nr:unnamed protein product [Hymenolepis diminuta]VUZ53987.1 unnamed protein product [Hymenolepis diminuta]